MVLHALLNSFLPQSEKFGTERVNANLLFVMGVLFLFSIL